MKINIKKTEINVLKQALRDCATLYEEDCWLGYNHDAFQYMFTDGKRRECPLEIKFWDYKKSYKISQLKKLAMIEYRIVEEQYNRGWLKKIEGNLSCWWRWTVTDKNWKKTRFGKKGINRRKKKINVKKKGIMI